MAYNPPVFEAQFPIVKEFVYHLVYYRALGAAYSRHQLKSEFWAATINAHLIRAVIVWCMVFGSDSSDIHWKRLSDKTPAKFRAGFYKGLEQRTGFDKLRWERLRKQMTDFRNKFVAHHELIDPLPVVPLLDGALDVVYFYDNWVRKVITPAFVEPLLKASAERIKKDVTPLIERFMSLG